MGRSLRLNTDYFNIATLATVSQILSATQPLSVYHFLIFKSKKFFTWMGLNDRMYTWALCELLSLHYLPWLLARRRKVLVTAWICERLKVTDYALRKRPNPGAMS